MEQRRLGRGLQSLLSADSKPITAMSMVSIDELTPNPRQPREVMDEGALDQLAQSIRKAGVLQPIVVRRHGRDLQIIAGERRWRAARRAGIKEVPVVVREGVSDAELLELALLENVQRVDLGAIEKARGYQQLIRDFGSSVESLASGLGQDRATVSNLLRLLDLEPEIQEAIGRGAITAGHGRALLAVPDRSRRQDLFERTLRDELSVRDVEAEAAQAGARRRGELTGKKKEDRPTWLADLEERWTRRLGVRVRIDLHGVRSRVTVHCAGLDELERVTDLAVGLGESRSEPREIGTQEASA